MELLWAHINFSEIRRITYKKDTKDKKGCVFMASILQNIGMTLAKVAISAFGAKNVAKTAVNNPKTTAKIVKKVIKSQIKKK